MDLKNFFDKYEQQRVDLKEKYGEDFDKPISSFPLNKAEQAVIDAWYKDLLPEILKIQKAQGINSVLVSEGEAYYGAVGGGLTYSFIPTSLGVIVTVREAITGKELNVSDALDWFFYG